MSQSTSVSADEPPGYSVCLRMSLPKKYPVGRSIALVIKESESDSAFKAVGDGSWTAFELVLDTEERAISFMKVMMEDFDCDESPKIGWGIMLDNSVVTEKLKIDASLGAMFEADQAVAEQFFRYMMGKARALYSDVRCMQHQLQLTETNDKLFLLADLIFGGAIYTKATEIV